MTSTPGFTRALVLALGLSAAASRAAATVVVAADLGELSRDARAIVRGRVVAVEGRWTDDRRTIETIVTLEVESYLKGALGPTLQFRAPGGELGRYRSIVVGAPEFVVDQHVIVFLGAVGPMVPYILGLNQGLYRLEPSADRAGWMVTPPAMLPAATTAAVVRGDAARRPMALGEFEQRVRVLAGSAR